MAIESILVISDTHRLAMKLREVMKQEKKRNFTRVLHLGDLEGEGKLVEEITGLPLEAVSGNCDYDREWPHETITQIGRHMVFMAHGHRYGVNYSRVDLVEMALGSGCDVALYGHTHVPEFTVYPNGFILANPGSLGHPRQHDQYAYRRAYMIIEHDTETDKLYFCQRYLKKGL